jgi:hypothetical protein
MRMIAALQQASIPELSAPETSAWADFAATAGGTALAATAVTLTGLFAYRSLTRVPQNSDAPDRSLQPRSWRTEALLAGLALLTSAALHLIGAESEEIGHQTLQAVEAAQNLGWGFRGWGDGEGGGGAAGIGLSRISGTEPLVLGDPRLIAEAQDALRHWRDTGELGDLSGFLARTSARIGEPHPSGEWRAGYLAGWNGYLETQEALRDQVPIDTLDTIDTIAEASALLGPYQTQITADFPYYRLDQPHMASLYETHRGNCEARALTMGAAFSDVVPRLPSHLVLTMEIFSRHIQPVLYDLRDELSWDLWTGEIQEENKGDLYHAAILYHSFLEAQGAESPVSEEDLLIARALHPDPEPPEAARETAPNWSSAFRFPASEAYFIASPHESSPPEGTTEEDDDHASAVQSLRDDLSWGPWEFSLLDNGYGREPDIVFRTLAEQEHYEALQDPAAQREYLISLFEHSLSQYASTEGFRTLMRLLEDPYERLPQATPEELDAATAVAGVYVDGMRTNLAIIRYLHGTPEEAADGGASLHASVLRHVPECGRLARRERAFADSIVEDPGAFFLMLNEVSGYERKPMIFDFMMRVSPDARDPLAALHNLLLDPARLDMARDPSAVTPHRVPRLEEGADPDEGGEFIEIEVVSDPWPLGDIFPAEAETEAAEEAQATPEVLPDETAQVLVTPETLIDAILISRSWLDEEGVTFRLVPRRWSPALADAYERLPQDQGRDSDFFQEVRDLLWESMTQDETDRFEDRLSSLEPEEDFHRAYWRLLSPRLPILSAPIRRTFAAIRRRRGDIPVSSQGASARGAGPSPVGWRWLEDRISERNP